SVSAGDGSGGSTTRNRNVLLASSRKLTHKQSKRATRWSCPASPLKSSDNSRFETIASATSKRVRYCWEERCVSPFCTDSRMIKILRGMTKAEFRLSQVLSTQGLCVVFQSRIEFRTVYAPTKLSLFASQHEVFYTSWRVICLNFFLALFS